MEMLKQKVSVSKFLFSRHDTCRSISGTFYVSLLSSAKQTSFCVKVDYIGRLVSQLRSYHLGLKLAGPLCAAI
jgi:hypothetical protein